MAQRTGSRRRKTRNKLRKNIRQKGKISINNYLQGFKIRDRVAFIAEPAVQKGIYDRRFHGLTGEIIKKRGNCYEIKVHNFNKIKTIIAHPVHLRKA